MRTQSSGSLDVFSRELEHRSPSSPRTPNSQHAESAFRSTQIRVVCKCFPPSPQATRHAQSTHDQTRKYASPPPRQPHSPPSTTRPLPDRIPPRPAPRPQPPRGPAAPPPALSRPCSPTSRPCQPTSRPCQSVSRPCKPPRPTLSPPLPTPPPRTARALPADARRTRPPPAPPYVDFAFFARGELTPSTMASRRGSSSRKVWLQSSQ
jgi:hypothetical protein